jgi:hypothetical protein
MSPTSVDMHIYLYPTLSIAGDQFVTLYSDHAQKIESVTFNHAILIGNDGLANLKNC